MKIDAGDLIDELGIKRASKLGNELRFHCPFPEHSHGDRNPSASINVKTLRWNCAGCHRAGNERSLVQEVENLEPFQVTRWLDERFGGVRVTEPSSLEREIAEILAETREEVTQERPLVRLSSTVFARYRFPWVKAQGDSIGMSAAPWRYMVRERRFSPKILDMHGIGWCGQQQRITIPVADAEGNLVGFRGRTVRTDYEPRYVVMRGHDFDPYPVSRVVWGLHSFKWKSEDPVKDRLIIVEGELDGVAMRQMGFWNVVATQGSQISLEQMDLIASSCDRAVFLFDSDEAGRKGMLRAADKLETRIKLETVGDHDWDPASLMREAIVTDGAMEGAIGMIQDLLSRAIPTTIAALV